MAEYEEEDPADEESAQDSMDVDSAGAGVTEDSDGEMDAGADGQSDSDEDEVDERDEEADARMLAQLQDQVASNPSGYDGHLKLIQLATVCGELEILRDARERMSELFPLTEDLWQAWIKMETQHVDKTDATQVAKINALYERAVQDYLSVDLWLDYATWMYEVHGITSEESMRPIREVFERGVTAVGLHARKGNMLWSSYRDVEQGYLTNLSPSTGETLSPDRQAKYDKQLQRIKDLFKRELSVPLLGMENSLEEYKTFTGHEPDAVVQKIFDKTIKKLEEIVPFEEKLEQANEHDKYRIFVSYIEHEKDPARIRVLYESALVPYCLSADLWSRYLDFLDRKFKVPDLALAAHERAVRNLPWALDLWMSYLRAVEYFQQDETVVKGVFDRVYMNGCTLPSHYVDLWLVYLSYKRRLLPAVPRAKTDGGASSVPEIDALRDLFSTAVSDLGSKEADPDNKIEVFWAAVEAGTIRDVEKGRGLWEKIMKNHQRDSAFWLQYYRFERLFGDETKCRKILKHAVLRNLDDIDAVAAEWMCFEREVGSRDDWMEANHFCKDSVKRVADRLAKLEKAAALEAAKLAAAPKKNFRLRDTWEDDSQDPRERPQRGDRDKHHEKPAEDARGQRPGADKRKRSEDEQSGSNGFKVPTVPAAVVAKKQKVVDTVAAEKAWKSLLSQKTPEGDSPPERTIFISNMSYSTTEEGVLAFFGKVGEIRDVRLIRDDKTKRSRGFGYVEFIKTESAKEALKLDRQDLEGRPVFVSKHSDNKEERESHFQGTGGEEKNKLFIRNLISTVTKEDLIPVFEQFGTLKEVRMVFHKSGMSKGIGYVEYGDAATANKAMEATNGKEIKGKPMIVAISNPPARAPKQQQDKTNFDSSVPFLTGAGRPIVVPPPDGQRKSRSHVDLVPRSLLKQQTDAKILSDAAHSGPTLEVGAASSSLTAASSIKKSNEDFRNFFKKK